MTALDIFTYSGQQVRTVVIDGEPWFVATDVTTILGYKNGRAAVAQHTLEFHRGVSRFTTPSGGQDFSILSERGIYRLIMRSNVPDALDFQEWLAGEVLPTIRKTGSYGNTPALPQSYAAALRELAVSVEQKEELAAKVEALEPAAAAWDELASASGDFEVADAAKILARAGVMTGSQRLFAQLANLGWIHRGAENKWKAYQTAVDSGYMAERAMSHHHPRTGEVILDPPQVRVTAKGVERLRVKLGTLDLALTG